ncbi:hypothetical protein REPUB_Repub05bG0169900 [Reevesia pubescens]
MFEKILDSSSACFKYLTFPNFAASGQQNRILRSIQQSKHFQFHLFSLQENGDDPKFVWQPKEQHLRSFLS